MGVSWSSPKTVSRRRSMRRLAAPVTCGGRRGTLSHLAATTARQVARTGAGLSARGPAPTFSLTGASDRTTTTGQGPSHRDALDALERTHRRVVAQLAAQSTRPRVAASSTPPSRDRTSRPPAA